MKTFAILIAALLAVTVIAGCSQPAQNQDTSKETGYTAPGNATPKPAASEEVVADDNLDGGLSELDELESV